MQSRLKNQSGFTLIELLVVMVILGVVAALSYPAYASMVRRARYAEVKQQMGVMARELQVYRVESAQYPPETAIGVQPEGIKNWPDDPPLNGRYDYDNWPVGGGQCYIQIGFVPDNGMPTYPNNQINADPQSFKEFGDDLVLGVQLYDC